MSYAVLGFHDMLLRVWLPQDVTLGHFHQTLAEQLAVAHFRSADVFEVEHSLRHFAFQDKSGRLIEPDSEAVEMASNADLERAERYFLEAAEECKDAAESCADRALLADLLPYTRIHARSTITFVLAIAGPDELLGDSVRQLGTRIAQTLDGLSANPRSPLTQLSLYIGRGFAHYLIIGRTDGADFHSLGRTLVTPVNSLSVRDAYRVTTTTHIVAQRGLQIAEERLTGLGSDNLQVWSRQAPNVEFFGVQGKDLRIGSRFIVRGGFSAAEVARGGTSRIYRVYDPFEDVDRAVKFFDAGLGSAVFGEANILRNRTHPNIVRYIFIGRDEDRYFLVMEYIPGENLRTVMNDDPRGITPERAVEIILSVLDALAYVHPNDHRREQLRSLSERRDLTTEEADEMMGLMNAGVIHRDIKPENIMQRTNGDIVLVDFGIASPAGIRTYTQSGTRGYLAPDAGVDGWRPEDDIFACGCVLYELLTGELPYTDSGGSAVTEPVYISDRVQGLDDGLSSCIMKACAPDRGDRYGNALEFADALRTKVEGT